MKSAKKQAKMDMEIEKLKGFTIVSELDRKLCKYIGNFNLVGVSESSLRKQGLL